MTVLNEQDSPLPQPSHWDKGQRDVLSPKGIRQNEGGQGEAVPLACPVSLSHQTTTSYDSVIACWRYSGEAYPKPSFPQLVPQLLRTMK